MQVGNRGPWHAAALLLHSSKPTFPCDTLANLARQLLGHCDTPAATRMAKFCLDPGGTTAQGCSSTSLLRPESGGVTPAAQVWNFLSTLANPQTPDPFRLLLVKGAPVIPRTSSHLRNQKSSTKFIPVCCGAGEQRDGGQFRGRRNRYALSRRHASSCLPSDSIRDVSGMPAERPSPTSAPGATNGYFPRLVNPASCARCAARCWQCGPWTFSALQIQDRTPQYESIRCQGRMLVRACGFSALGCRGVTSSVGVRWVHGIRGIRRTVRVFPFRAFMLRFVFHDRSMNVVASINRSRTCRLQLGQVELPRSNDSS